MAIKRDDITPVRQRKYLARDFDSLRAQLLEYARLYYPDRLRDFSESSLGGMFLDLAAYVGDNMSFYLDHQYAELNSDDAIETTNIQKHLRSSGVPIVGAAPAVVPVTVYVQVPATTAANTVVPREDCMPVIAANSTFVADNGVEFILMENLDYGQRRSDGSLKCEIRVGNRSSSGIPTSFIMALNGICVSGKFAQENFVIGSTFVPFRRLQLANSHVSEIINVTDSLGNIYYQVEALSHDVVYQNVLNTSKDNDLVPESIKVIPAPYRYMTSTDLDSRKTTLTFGGGSADTMEDDIIPDPSEFAISFPYSKTFSRISLDPQRLLMTNTLGVAATNTTLSVSYRYGGGLNHSVPANAIKTIKTINVTFPGNPPAGLAAQVRNTLECTNLIQAKGGEDAPTIDDLKALIPSVRNAQSRVVSREDLIARVYTIPSNFGRVFRAAVRSNENNPLATQLYIVSRSPDQKLVTSPDTLKNNLKRYLNPYREISDAIDILDARIVNLALNFEIIVDPALNNNIVLQNVLKKLQDVFNIKRYHIDQPIIKSEVENAIFSIVGVMAIDRVQFSNVVGIVNNRTYSDCSFDVDSNTTKNVIVPPSGGIFEIRYPEVDIIGKVV